MTFWNVPVPIYSEVVLCGAITYTFLSVSVTVRHPLRLYVAFASPRGVCRLLQHSLPASRGRS